MSHSQSPSPSRLSFTPNSSDSKAESIVKNFYIKAAQTIIQSRQPQQEVDERKRTNRWFNMNTREHPDALRSELKYWITRAFVSPITQPPPLVIEVYLDVSNIPPDKQLELQGGRRLDQPCIVDLHEPVKRSRIVLENWILTLSHPLPTQALDLGNVYKRSILFFRTLYAFARLLPAYRTNQRINIDSADDDIFIGYRLTSSVTPMPDEIALDEGPDFVTQSLDSIVTPLGTLGLQVQYRANCDFVIHDPSAELDPSTQLMDLDQHYFEPTIAKYTIASSDDDNDGSTTMATSKATTKWPPVPRRSESARVTTTTATAEQQHSFRRPSSTTVRGTRPPALSLRPLSMADGDKLFTRSAEPPSKLHVSPFKSPTLSSSSQHSSTFCTALRSIKGDDSQRKNATRRFSSSFDRHLDIHYHSAPMGQHAANDIPTSPTASIKSRRSYSAARRLSIASEQDEELEEFVRSLNLRRSPGFHSRILNEEIDDDLYAPSLEASTVYRSKKALARFQNMRGMHDSLSQSLISSTILSPPDQQQQQQVGATKEQSVRASKEDIIASSSSSLLSSSVLKGSPMGRLYQPRAPSPLHTEQPSTTDTRSSPVRIPLRRYEQHTPDSNSDTSSEQHDIYPSFMYSSQRSHLSEIHPLAPQSKDPARQQLEPVPATKSQPQPKRIPRYTSRRRSTRLTMDTESTSSSSGNDKEDEEPTSPTAQDEDDDSLVFKMSELGLYEHK